jgi:hypothetical protein
MPVYFRTLAELVAPLEQQDSPVRGAFAVERAQVREAPTPFGAAFRRGGDVGAYAETYTGFLRAVSEPVVRAALRQPDCEAVIIERLYKRIQARLQAEPERNWFRNIMGALVLTRR